MIRILDPGLDERTDLCARLSLNHVVWIGREFLQLCGRQTGFLRERCSEQQEVYNRVLISLIKSLAYFGISRLDPGRPHRLQFLM